MQGAGHYSTSSLEGLGALVEALTARVEQLEERLGLAVAEQSPVAAGETLEIASTADAGTGLQLPAVGSALLMLAGAFLLRAVTDAGRLTPAVGVSLGLAYVMVLLLLTDRVARRGLRAWANLFGAATVLVAFPFIWETATTPGMLPAAGAAAVTALVTTLALGLALRHRLGSLAWIVLLAGVFVCAGLFWATDGSTLFLAVLLALGVATVWLAYLREWRGPRWLVACAANGYVFITVMLAAHPPERAAGRPQPAVGEALALALLLPAAYLVSFSWRTLVRRREAGLFEILQSLGCILAGYVGAIHLLRGAGRGTVALGWGTLLVGIAGYVVAFLLVRGRQGRGLNFFYHAWLGLVLTLIGTALVVSAGWLPYLWAGLGAAAAVTGGIFDRWTLRLHCAAYLVGAAVGAGLFPHLHATFGARGVPGWHGLGAPDLAAWLLSLLCYAILLLSQRGRDLSGWRRAPRFLVAALVLAGGGIVIVTLLARWAAGAVSGAEHAVVAVVRTAVLAATAVLLAFLGRRPALRELAWFVNPLLALIALKLLFEDLRVGTPVSLFCGFTCFGVALIAAPRLRRAAVEPASGPEPAAGVQDATGEGTHETDTP